MTSPSGRRLVLGTLSDADTLDSRSKSSRPLSLEYNKPDFQSDGYRLPPRYTGTYVKPGIWLPAPGRKASSLVGSIVSPLRGVDLGSRRPDPLKDGVVVSCSWDATIKVWDLTSGMSVNTGTGHAGPVYCSAMFGQTCLLTGSGDMSMKMWGLSKAHDPATYNRQFYPLPCLQSFVGHKWPINSICVLPKMIVSGSGDKTLKVWHPKTGRCRGTLVGHKSSVDCCTIYSQNPALLISGSYDQTFRLWDLQTGITVSCIQAHDAPINCLHLLPDGRIVSGASDNAIKLWDIRNEQCCGTLLGHKGAVTAVAILDNMRLLSGSVDMAAMCWDLATGQSITTYIGHTGHVQTIATIDDSHFVSGSSDNTLKVWDIKTGLCCSTLKGHQGSVTSVHQLRNV